VPARARAQRAEGFFPPFIMALPMKMQCARNTEQSVPKDRKINGAYSCPHITDELIR